MRRISGRICIAMLAAMSVATAGCGSPMKTVRPTGMATGTVFSVAGMEMPATPVPIVALRDVTSRGVGKYPVTTTESTMFAVSENVAGSDGTVLITKGTHVSAKVTRKEHTRLARPGWLEISFVSTKSASGALVRLDENAVRFEGKSRKGGMIAGAVLVSLLFLLRTGGDVTVQAGSTFVSGGAVL